VAGADHFLDSLAELPALLDRLEGRGNGGSRLPALGTRPELRQ